MDNSSSFQRVNPLSQKKYWKKMVPSIAGLGILMLFPSLAFGAIISFLKSKEFASSSSAFLFFVSVSALGFAILFIIALFLRSWYVKTYIKRYYYDCNDQFVTIQKGVFAPAEIHVQYQKIQDVYVDQDVLDRLMGLYDVHIASATATSSIEAHIDGLEKDVAERIKNFMLNKIQSIPSQTSSGNAAVAPADTKSYLLESQEKYSSKEYPISSIWLVQAYGKGFIVGFVFYLVFFGPFFLSAGITYTYGLLGSAVCVFIYAVWVTFWKKNFYFEFLPEFILLRTGVVSSQENHMPYKSVQNITLSQGLIEKLFGIATVRVENAAVPGTVRRPNYGLLGLLVSVQASEVNNGISLVGQPYKQAKKLNDVLNGIVSKQPTSATGL